MKDVSRCFVKLCGSVGIFGRPEMNVFNHTPVDPVFVVTKAPRDEAEYIAAQMSLSSSIGADSGNRVEEMPRWRPPAPGFLKVNCDVAVNLRSSSGATAIVLRDAHGSLVNGMVRAVAVSSATLVCLMVISLNLTMVEVEGDNKQVIQLYVKMHHHGSVALLLMIFGPWLGKTLSFKSYSRKANGVAHWVAQACLGFIFLSIGCPSLLWLCYQFCPIQYNWFF
ncbi:hypothetical protein LOK49_LG06G02544 [Camellia lanceoleosa]|uniref:Uncharacterized protein n=1 Tax=Camellia lanceoleosa TaxID=1840588 RepID=A0ACC0HEM6_9ERIC|nr:hypothetical protein LOK49_LG06G02544 [Camellia lanceoleosa]